jgi:hypothetical protein
VQWFDDGRSFRPAWLDATPRWIPLGAAAAFAAVAWRQWRRERPSMQRPRDPWLWLSGLLALGFRLPLALGGSAGYLTPDGALSGIVALRVRDGLQHYVFVPSVPYSGSLKSHLAAALALSIDPSRAFALASIAFYALFASALYMLSRLADPARPQRARVAALWAAFAPAFVTRYSLSNDGNYVEVVALGTAALVVGALWLADGSARTARGFLCGFLLGLTLWCHLVAILYVAALVVFFAWAARLRAVRSVAALGSGLVLGYVPGILWNATHGWESLQYLVPGGQPVGALAQGPGMLGRFGGLVTNVPILVGYDVGYPVFLKWPMAAAALVGLALLAPAVARVFRAAMTTPASVDSLLASLVLTTVVVVVAALPHLPGNPRYLLSLFVPLAVCLGRSASTRVGRLGAGLLIGLGLLGSLGQAPAALRADRDWRGFAADLERDGVRRCHTDFHLATKINFLSHERIVCAATLGPTMTEYFPEYRDIVRSAHDPAIVAVNRTSAERIERRLRSLDVTYTRRDSMKPFFFGLSRRVEPEELFPGRFATP